MPETKLNTKTVALMVSQAIRKAMKLHLRFDGSADWNSMLRWVDPKRGINTHVIQVRDLGGGIKVTVDGIYRNIHARTFGVTQGKPVPLDKIVDYFQKVHVIREQIQAIAEKDHAEREVMRKLVEPFRKHAQKQSKALQEGVSVTVYDAGGEGVLAVRVRTKDMELLGRVLDAVLEAGKEKP